MDPRLRGDDEFFSHDMKKIEETFLEKHPGSVKPFRALHQMWWV
jgi:hypothetical protein